MNSIMLGNYEYFLDNVDGNKYTLVSNKDNRYDGRIIEVTINGNVKLKVKDFEKGRLNSIIYVLEDGNMLNMRYYSKIKQGLMADNYEQPSIFNIKMESLFINDEKCHIKLDLRRDNGKTIKMVASEGRYNFSDINDGDVFHITSRSIYEGMEYINFIPRALPRLLEFLDNPLFSPKIKTY